MGLNLGTFEGLDIRLGIASVALPYVVYTQSHVCCIW